MKDSGSVYCIVVTYNAMRWADRCFTSIRHSGVPLNTIVVDNGSSDGTQKYLSDNFPEFDLIQSPANVGFGRGNNIGLKKAFDAGGRFFFLLNQDAWLNRDTVESLCDIHSSHVHFQVLSPMHLEGSGQWLDEQFAHYIGPRKSAFFNDLYAGNPKDVYECRFVNAAAWLLTRECLEKVGLFEPLFFIYGEDQNYMQRALYHRCNMGIVPKATIVHDRMQRKGAKNKIGSALERDTYVLMQLLNVGNSGIRNMVNAFKVFARFGVSGQSLSALMKGLLKIFVISQRRGLARKSGYLIGGKS
jgi:GT2 family glycosyltransferase